MACRQWYDLPWQTCKALQLNRRSCRFLQPDQPPLRINYRVLLAAVMSRNEGDGRVSLEELYDEILC